MIINYLRIIIINMLLLSSLQSLAQGAQLIGYWHNWNTAAAPYIPIHQVDNRYTIVIASFAIPTSATDMTMTFTPDGTTTANFIANMRTLQNRGKKVLLSIGGANATIELETVAQKTAFINSMTQILNMYPFDGIDIDIEHGNCILANGGTIAQPVASGVLNLIASLKQIMVNFRNTYQRKMFLTFSPETAYVQGGQSAYSSIWGGYLPTLHALRDSTDYIQVQLYNSGSMYGINQQIYYQGTADFITAMTEAVIKGFNTNGGYFAGYPSSKVVVSLPACSQAAGGGYIPPATVQAAIKYLCGMAAKPAAANYSLAQNTGYPALGGMATWSINWDAVATCGGAYEFANSYTSIFGNQTNSVELTQPIFKMYPNPAQNVLYVDASMLVDRVEKVCLYDHLGRMLKSELIDNQLVAIQLEDLDNGIYYVRIGTSVRKVVIQK
jgi:chitinase